MAIHDITSQKDLVAKLGEGWDAPKLNKTLNGIRRWAVDDLAALAQVFHVAPGALLGSTADLVGVVAHPAASGGHVSGPVSIRNPSIELTHT